MLIFACFCNKNCVTKHLGCNNICKLNFFQLVGGIVGGKHLYDVYIVLIGVAKTEKKCRMNVDGFG